jgi:hypothetical protein
LRSLRQPRGSEEMTKGEDGRAVKVLLPLKRHLKCTGRSTQPIRHRRTAPQVPRNRIRANADNRKSSRPSLFHAKPRTATSIPHTCFRRIPPQKILVSRFMAKTWPAFHSLWQESGIGSVKPRQGFKCSGRATRLRSYPRAGPPVPPGRSRANVCFVHSCTRRPKKNPAP